MAEFREYGTTRHPSGMAISRGMWCDGVARAEQSRTLAERGKRGGVMRCCVPCHVGTGQWQKESTWKAKLQNR